MSQPFLGQEEERNVLDALRSGWVSPHGPYVDAFEARFAELCGARYALAVSSGTAALHLALAGLRVAPGDEVIVPTLTYVATANVVRYLGAEPVFVDVDPRTWCLSPEAIADAFTERTRGVIAVDLYGYPADLSALRAAAAEHDAWIVEDAAEAIGATRRGAHVGHMADASAFSFYGNKVVSCGQGGAVTVDDEDLYLRLKSLRNQARQDEHPYKSSEVGYNYGLSNVSCAILCAQLDRLSKMLRERHHVIETYAKCLTQHPTIGIRAEPTDGESAPWLASIAVGDGSSPAIRDELARDLLEGGIETRPFFHPLHLLPPYVSSRRVGQLNNSLQLSFSGINLPTYAGMPTEDVDYVCRNVLEFLTTGSPGR